MCRAAARVGGAGRIESRGVLVDVEDLAVLPDDERHAVGNPGRLVEDAVFPADVALGEIAQEGHGDVILGRKFPLRRDVVGADPKYLGVGAFEFRNTSLVCLEFLRSTTGERGGVKR